jgi:hypothetical protein
MSLSVRDAAVDLTVAVLQAIEEAIAFFSSSQSKLFIASFVSYLKTPFPFINIRSVRRAFRSLFKGSEYLTNFQKVFQSIKEKSNDLRNQGQGAHIENTERCKLSRFFFFFWKLEHS